MSAVQTEISNSRSGKGGLAALTEGLYCTSRSQNAIASRSG